MSKIIAVVRLAPGQVAFYDELTGTHLTMGNPMAEIADHMNTTRIKRAVHNKILNLVTGGFNVENPTPEQKVVEVEPAKAPAPKVEQVKEAVAEVVEPVIEEVVEPTKEEVPAEVVEETVEETVEEATEEVEAEVETESKPKSKRKKKED